MAAIDNQHCMLEERQHRGNQQSALHVGGSAI
jgi:hypothetical protein